MTEITPLPTWPRLGIRPAVVVALLVGLVGCFLLSLTLGSVKIPLPDILTILSGGEPARAGKVPSPPAPVATPVAPS